MDDDVKAVAERLIEDADLHWRDYDREERFADDILTVATYALEAADRQAALALELGRLKEALDWLVDDHGQRWLPLLEEMHQVRHSRDCRRATLPANYDRGGDVMLMGPCNCGRDEITKRMHEAVSAQRAAIISVIVDQFSAVLDTTTAVAPGADELARLRGALKTVYGLAAEIQRQTAFAEIGFKCSLIREAVSRSLPDDEAKWLYDQTEAALDAAPAVALDTTPAEAGEQL